MAKLQSRGTRAGNGHGRPIGLSPRELPTENVGSVYPALPLCPYGGLADPLIRAEKADLFQRRSIEKADAEARLKLLNPVAERREHSATRNARPGRCGCNRRA